MRVSKAPTKKNQINQRQQASEANRRVQFSKECEVKTLLKGNKKSKQQSGNSQPNQQRAILINSSKIIQEVSRFSGRN